MITKRAVMVIFLLEFVKTRRMASKKEETVSFVLRFTQKIFETDDGEQNVQWRGNVKHVQGDDEKRFTEFEDAVGFMQEKLTDLTIKGIEDKSPKEQKGILAKNFELWKKMTMESQKLVFDVIKDPKKQLAQMQTQVSQLGDTLTQQIEEKIGQKIDVDEWRASSKSDHKNLIDVIDKLSKDVARLHKKVDKIGKTKK